MHAIEENLFRITCTCTTPEHVMDFQVDDGIIWCYPNTDNHKIGLIDRFKNAIKILLGKPVYDWEMVIDQNDLKELVLFLEDRGAFNE